MPFTAEVAFSHRTQSAALPPSRRATCSAVARISGGYSSWKKPVGFFSILARQRSCSRRTSCGTAPYEPWFRCRYSGSSSNARSALSRSMRFREGSDRERLVIAYEDDESDKFPQILQEVE